MSANTELFVTVLAQIERHPQRWDQTRYVNDCGTAYCFAGWALHLTGEWWDRREFRGNPGYYFFLFKGPNTPRETAASLLGLEGDHDLLEGPGFLFSPTNTLDDLYRISAAYCGLDEQVLRDKVAAEVADGEVQQ